MIKALTFFSAFAALKVFGLTKRKSSIMPYRCVGCGDCKKVCPQKAIRLIKGKAQVDAEKCIGCFLCSAACSYGAIGRWEKKD